MPEDLWGRSYLRHHSIRPSPSHFLVQWLSARFFMARAYSLSVCSSSQCSRQILSKSPTKWDNQTPLKIRSAISKTWQKTAWSTQSYSCMTTEKHSQPTCKFWLSTKSPKQDLGKREGEKNCRKISGHCWYFNIAYVSLVSACTEAELCI